MIDPNASDMLDAIVEARHEETLRCLRHALEQERQSLADARSDVAELRGQLQERYKLWLHYLRGEHASVTEMAAIVRGNSGVHDFTTVKYAEGHSIHAASDGVVAAVRFHPPDTSGNFSDVESTVRTIWERRKPIAIVKTEPLARVLATVVAEVIGDTDRQVEIAVSDDGCIVLTVCRKTTDSGFPVLVTVIMPRDTTVNLRWPQDAPADAPSAASV